MTDKKTKQFERVCVIGVGLIGSSFVLAMRENGLAGTVVGYDRDVSVLKRASDIGVIDETASTLEEGVKGADLIVLSTPVRAISEVCAALEESVSDQALIIDVGSVKGVVAEAAEKLSPRLMFVPCHPVAGTEQSGPEAGFSTLFKDRWCIVTPLNRAGAPYQQAVDDAKALWSGVGAQVEVMDAAHHDLALAVTSHLPHLIAFTLVGAADDVESVAHGEVVKYSAGGFRDFTRIAASDPVMWRDVFLTNKDAVLEVLGRFSEELAVMQRAIRWGDGKALEDAFARGRALRRAIVDAGQETAKPDFGRGENEN